MKKIASILFLLTISLLANQAPDYTAIADQMYEKMKKTTFSKSKTMLPKMIATRECLSKANNKSEARICSNKMQIEHSKEDLSMMDAFGVTKEQIKAEKRKYENDFIGDGEWNQKTKEDTLKKLDKAIKTTKSLVKCFEESGDFKSFTICTRKSGIK